MDMLVEHMMSSTKLIQGIEKYWPLLPKWLQTPKPNQLYRSNNYVCVDFETTNINKGDPYNHKNRIVLSVWYCGPGHPNGKGDGAYYFQWGNEFELAQLRFDCEKADFVIAHNAKFEYGWLDRAGLETAEVVPYCTQIGEYVLAGNRAANSYPHGKWGLSLEATLKRRGLGGKGSLVSTLIKNGVCPSQIPRPWLLRYGLLDVYQTVRLFLQQREDLYLAELLPVQFTRCIVIPCLVDLEQRGMALDKDRVLAVWNYYNKAQNDLRVDLDKLSGGINYNSPLQKREFLYGENGLNFNPPLDYRGREIRTPKGELSTANTVLPGLKAKTKKQKQFVTLMLQMSEVNGLLSKNLKKMKKCVEDPTSGGIVHYQYNQTITATHRLSSTGREYKMQGQNIPGELKPLYTTRYPGWKFNQHDQGQLEYRTAVFLGRDETGLWDIQNGVDSHSFTASIIFRESWGKDGSKLAPGEFKRVRQDSKEHTFKPLYGGTSGTSREQEYYEAFRRKHKGITRTQQEWLDECLRNSCFRTCNNVTFYFPDTYITRSGYIRNTTNICNYPVQSFAGADIVLAGLVYQWHLVRVAKLLSFLVNTVHDSVLGEVHPEEGELFNLFAVKAHTEIVIWYLREVYGLDFNVPLELEGDSKSHWEDSEEWKKKYNILGEEE